MMASYTLQTCLEARNILQNYRKIPHNETVLKMALEDLVEIEDGILDNVQAEDAARHVVECRDCTLWLDKIYPARKKLRKALEIRQKTFCCLSMADATQSQDVQTRFRFTLFRGEDPCWMINDEFSFARFCPWCGTALPNRPFGSSPDKATS